jgi:hypothetical protein
MRFQAALIPAFMCTSLLGAEARAQSAPTTLDAPAAGALTGAPVAAPEGDARALRWSDGLRDLSGSAVAIADGALQRAIDDLGRGCRNPGRRGACHQRGRVRDRLTRLHPG